MKRLFALLICAALLLSLLAGCGRNTASKPEKSPEMTAEEDPADTDAAPEPIEEQPLMTDPDLGIDVGFGGSGYGTYAPDTVTGYVNGSEVTWMEYYYWLTYYARMLLESSIENGITVSSWDAVGEMSETMSNAEVVITAAQYMMKYYHAIQTGAESSGVALSAQDRAELEEVYSTYQDEDADGTVSEEEAASYERFLAEQCVDKDFLMYLLEIAKLTDVTFDTLYGKSGEKYSDEDTMAFIAENGYMSAKRIVLLTIDGSTGNTLDEETIAEKTALAERISEELAAAAEEGTDELIALFDEYMAEYSEDTGLADYPDGYVFMNDGSPLTTITAGLDENYGLSGAEETYYGYEIVLRQPVLPDTVEKTDVDGNSENMRYLAAEWEQQLLVTAWTDTAEVTWNEGFDSPDLLTIYG